MLQLHLSDQKFITFEGATYIRGLMEIIYLNDPLSAPQIHVHIWSQIYVPKLCPSCEQIRNTRIWLTYPWPPPWASCNPAYLSTTHATFQPITAFLLLQNDPAARTIHRITTAQHLLKYKERCPMLYLQSIINFHFQTILHVFFKREVTNFRPCLYWT